MYLCNDKHEEVCYESRGCPVCDMRTELENKVAELENEISILETQVE